MNYAIDDIGKRCIFLQHLSALHYHTERSESDIINKRESSNGGGGASTNNTPADSISLYRIKLFCHLRSEKKKKKMICFSFVSYSRMQKSSVIRRFQFVFTQY